MEMRWRNLALVICLSAVRCFGSEDGDSKKQQPIELGTDFDCNGKIGFYADVNKNCSIFYYCQWDSARLTLSCPENTWFNQKHLQCEGGERKQCLKSKKYYNDRKKLLHGLNQRKQNVPNGRQKERSKRQALYIPPSAVNTFVVRYYVPSGAASVSEQDTFGSNAAIYLPEHYRIAVNPDAESAVHLTRPVTSKEQYTKTKIHYLERPTDSPTKPPYTNSLQDSVQKPIIHSTQRPDLIRRPDTERVIRPINHHEYERNSQDLRNIRNNYNSGRNPHDLGISNNYHHSQYSVPSRDEGTYVHHPRKAGHKLYHPSDYSSPAQYRRPPDSDYDYSDAQYRPSQPKYINRYPGNLYEEDDNGENYYYHNRPRDDYRSNGYSYPVERPTYLPTRPYQDYPREIPYNTNSNPHHSEGPSFDGENEHHYRNAGKSNESPKVVNENDQRNEQHDNDKERENSNKDSIQFNHYKEESPRNAATHTEDSRNNYNKYERPGSEPQREYERPHSEEKPNVFRENNENYKAIPYVRYLNEDGKIHEPDNARPSQEQLEEYNGKNYGPSHERDNIKFYNENQQGNLYHGPKINLNHRPTTNLNHGPIIIDKLQARPDDERTREEETDYRTEELSNDSRQPSFSGHKHQGEPFVGGERNIPHLQESTPVQPFIERKPIEKVTEGRNEERVPIISTDKLPLRNDHHSVISEVPLKHKKVNGQSGTELINKPQTFDYSVNQEPSKDNQQHTVITESQPNKEAQSHFDTSSHKNSFPIKSNEEYHQQPVKESIAEQKPRKHSNSGHLFVSSNNQHSDLNKEERNVELKNKNPNVNERAPARDKIFIGSTHYINNNENAKSRKYAISKEEEKKEKYTTTELPTTFPLFDTEKFGDRIVKSSDDSAESKESVNKGRHYESTTTQALPTEFHHSPRIIGGRTSIANQGRVKDSTEYDRATPTHSFTFPYVHYKEKPAKEKKLTQNTNPVGLRTSSRDPNKDIPSSDEDTVAQNPSHVHKEVRAKIEYKTGHENHRQEYSIPSGFNQNHFTTNIPFATEKSQFNIQTNPERIKDSNSKHVPQREGTNHRHLQPNFSPIGERKFVAIHKDKSIIGRHHDLQYSEPNLSAAQDKVPAYVTVTPPVSNSEATVTQHFTFTETKTATAATYPLTYEVQDTTETPFETSTVRIRKQKRRRKKGRRRRPKKPRLQTTSTQEQMINKQNHTEQQLSYATLTETVGTTVPTTLAHRYYSETENVKPAREERTEFINQRIEVEPTTQPLTTAQPRVAASQSSSDGSASPTNESSVDRARKRQVRYRNRKRKFSRPRMRSTTTTIPTEADESSSEKSFTYQSMDEVTTSQPVTPYKATRTRVLRQKSKTRPRLFGFGKPKPSDSNSSAESTTVSSITT